MYHNLFRTTLLFAAIAIISTACNGSVSTSAPETKAPIVTEITDIATKIIPTNTPEPSATQVVLGVVAGTIAFVSNSDGNNEIYVMSGDGSALTNLTNNPADDGWEDYGPVWSPDGTRILFSSSRDGNREIYVMNSDGSDQTNLTNNPANDGEMDWSPDGTQIVFDSNRDGNQEIYVMNAHGSGLINLTNAPAPDDFFPKWSADGKQIGFTSVRDGNAEIYLMNAMAGTRPA
jgi:Tol biopolymer transport system component